ncbi:hypothetical protein CSA37_04825 [Candidatus Fermentibacteria bacterium]|nr:MAG: hypothetical protein CSA37_04825 [Candidatus Fermentibacteria bacterium]
MKLNISAVLSLLILMACGSAGGPGVPGAVITIGDRSVTADDVTESFERYRGDTLSVNILKENIIARELFLAHAFELELDQDREGARLSHERAREYLQSALLEHMLGLVESDYEAVRAFWNSLGTSVEYRALAVRDPLVMDTVVTRLQEGVSLSTLAVKYGIDPITIQSEGLISLQDRMYSNLMDLEPLSGNLEPGQIIGPFEVPVGLRILQIDSVWTYEPGPFSGDSARIARLLLARAREARKQFIEDSLKTNAQIEINQEAIALLAQGSVNNGREFRDFTPEENEITVLSWNSGSRDVYSVSENIEHLPVYLPRETDNLFWLEEYAVRLALFDMEMEAAQQLGLDTVPETAEKIRIASMEILLDSYYEQVISPRIQPDSALLQELYLEVRDDYPVEESRVYNVLLLESQSAIHRAEEIMGSGEDMLDYAENFKQFPQILAEGEEYLTVPLTMNTIPENDRLVMFSMETGDEQLISLADTVSLWFRLVEIIPAHTSEFDEIRDVILNLASQKLETEIIEGLVDSLEAVYHPYVDEEFFTSFYVSAETDSLPAQESPEGLTDAL